MNSPFPGFPRETLRFLRELKANNNREWFQARKDVYEEKVKRPMVELVLALGGALRGFAPELQTDPKRAIFRIYRDTRFSPDKSPYKTHIAAHFSPSGAGRDVGAGLYFHVDPAEGLFVAAGIYMPGSEPLRLLRAHVAGQPDQLRAILAGRKLSKLYGGLQGDQLTRPPRGYNPDDPALDLLRWKQYCIWFERPARLACSPEAFPVILDGFATAMPLVRYLNQAFRAVSTPRE